jgi:GT2 family glycosyltransferase
MSKCDIIIPTTFDTQYVNWCINSIQKFDMGFPYEITVVDNLSEPKFEREGIRSIRYEERLWFSKAMNEGIKNTSNDYVLLLNNDTGIAHDNFLGQLIKTLNSQQKIGIVSPSTNFIGNDVARCENLQSRDNKIIDLQGHVAAVCWILKRSTINDVGLFDEQFKNSHCDGDYCTRVLNAGYKIMIDRRNWLFHYGSRTVSRTPGYYEEFGRNSDRYTKKWSK